MKERVACMVGECRPLFRVACAHDLWPVVCLRTIIGIQFLSSQIICLHYLQRVTNNSWQALEGNTQRLLEPIPTDGR